MRQKRANVDVPLSDPAFLLASVMNDRDQPVPVSADIEDHVSIHIIGIFENLPDFQKVSPSYSVGNSVPRSNLSGGIRIFLFGLAQVLACNDVHGGLLERRSGAGFAAAKTPHFQDTLQIENMSRLLFHFAKYLRGIEPI
jgi:hypothetical protein